MSITCCGKSPSPGLFSHQIQNKSSTSITEHTQQALSLLWGLGPCLCFLRRKDVGKQNSFPWFLFAGWSCSISPSHSGVLVMLTTSSPGHKSILTGGVWPFPRWKSFLWGSLQPTRVISLTVELGRDAPDQFSQVGGVGPSIALPYGVIMPPWLHRTSRQLVDMTA